MNTNASSSRRSYISVAPFHRDFFAYTPTYTARNMFTYSITPVSGANAGNCPQGRVLREKGKKLYPGADEGVNTYMVAVYDAISGLSGYIDPNSPVFAPYNGDKPNTVADGVDPGPGGLTDLGAPVYTNGPVISVSGYISGNGVAFAVPTPDAGIDVYNLCLDLTTGNVFNYAFGGATKNSTINLYFNPNPTPSPLPPNGTQFSVILVNASGWILTLNTSVDPVYKGINNVSGSQLSIGNGKTCVLQFVSDGQYCYEASRTIF
jgi:hypothetical protein